MSNTHTNREIIYSLSGKNLTVIVDGEVFPLNTDNMESKEIFDILNSDNPDKKRLKTLCNKAAAVRDYFHNNLEIRGESVFYREEKIENELTEDIVRFMKEGAPYRPMLRYLENLMDNPSMHSIRQLYSFHKHNNLQITTDGYLIAYKGVRDDYYDKHSGRIWNGPGACPPPMKRNMVLDDPDIACAAGYHAGSLEYARGWGERVMRVKINPADVVSVPYDHNNAKIRITGYRVLDEVDPDSLKNVPIYNSCDYTSCGNSCCDDIEGDEEDYSEDNNVPSWGVPYRRTRGLW